MPRDVCYGCCLLLIALAIGCSRAHYRQRADAQSYSILTEKTAGTPWAVRPGFGITPDPSSRFYDPTPPDDPLLPIPAPQLYAYQLGALPQRDPARFRPAAEDSGRPPGEAGPAFPAPAVTASDASQVVLASYQPPAGVLPLGNDAAESEPGGYELPPPGSVPSAGASRVVAVPRSFWESVPTTCLVRMLEFSSVREEYGRSWGEPPSEELRDDAPRLALEDVVALAQINNREFQRQKEILYTTALALTQERYAYQLKFATSGNGTDVDFQHGRAGGVTDDSLSIPTEATADKVLATGGDLLARFANDVVLTYNGPQGFAADVGSELLLDLSQSVLQRDIVFEALTQAERNVVYAARDFARFRKNLFRDLAVQYYNLLLSYRDIEISTQDYFSNVRGFSQGQAEYGAGRLPRIQVDQFEQDALGSRSRLIGQCTNLESAFDQLKLLIGLPPETAINLDLTELEQLTLRDEATVAAELVRRAQRNLNAELGRPAPQQVVLVSGAVVLTQRLLSWIKLEAQLGAERPPPLVNLESSAQRLLVAEARLLVEFNEAALSSMGAASPLSIYQRTMDLIDSLLELAARYRELAIDRGVEASEIDALEQGLDQLRDRYEAIRQRLEDAAGLEILDELTMRAEALLADAQALVRDADQLTSDALLDPEQRERETLLLVKELLTLSQESLRNGAGGLVPVQIGMDDAMLTALVQRFDLMNERGALADTWRQIKFAGDDLRSILNLDASQTVSTRSDVNRAFDFTFDDSQTRLALSFDAPLNRRAQRNDFRQSLINYQAALRGLIDAEDQIKLSIRDDLRQLQLDREQYAISVASAALAFERVVSSRLELSLGRQNVTARDVLESQAAYTASLSGVASDHIGYILDRIDLFLDMETLAVDQDGFWPEVYDERYQPPPDFSPPLGAFPYGQLPPGICPSPRILRMLSIPWGNPAMPAETEASSAAELDESISQPAGGDQE